MSVPRIYLVQGDTRPRPIFTLRDKDGDPIDLSSAGQIRFLMRKVGETAVKDMTCLKLSGLLQDDDTVSYAPPYDAAGKGGRVQVVWAADALDAAGKYEAEIEITFGDGTKQTVYQRIPITVREQLA